MYLRQLVLANFRGYRRLLLDLQPGLTVFVGENGQGKSNLLESVHVLATTRSLRASSEGELINWQELEGPLPFARLEGRLVRGNGETHVEIVLRAETAAEGADGAPPAVSRLVRLNGLPARASDVVGQVVVVLFSPEDVALATGPPVGRRRYLDITCSQVSRRYLRNLQSYNRVLLQRNALLRQIRERRQARPSLSPWDDELVDLGSRILAHRLQLVAEVNGRLVECYRVLSGGSHEVRIAYRATVFEGVWLPPLEEADVSAEAIAAAFRSRLAEVAQRESEQAVTLVGPHRD
ncbi:MAG: DNA replication and repair protein RecF, partial [Chloroflexi bacterium]|nr:DNA replication and repair protein RecF [Chloroflexota bacterium]